MVELENFVNRKTVENAYRIVKIKRKTSVSMSIPQQGWRIALHRETGDCAKLLKALEGGAEILHQVTEEQRGRTSRDASTPFSEKVDPTEYTLWREAYKSVDSGRPEETYAWIYGAAGIIAGLVTT